MSKLTLIAMILVVAAQARAVHGKEAPQKIPAHIYTSIKKIYKSSLEQKLTGEISDLSGNATIKRIGVTGKKEILERLQIGDPIYPGDVISVKKDSLLEIVFGINARLLMSSDTRINIIGTDSQKVSKKETTLLRVIKLISGSVRVRVRKNSITPSPILLAASNLGALVERGDVVLKSSSTENSVSIISKSANVLSRKNERVPWQSAWVYKTKVNDVLRVEQTLGIAKEVIIANAKLDIKELTFSIDKSRVVLTKPPRYNSELQAP